MATTIKRADYPYLSATRFKEIVAWKKRKNYTERRVRNYLAKMNAEERDKVEQPAIKRLRVQIEWHKSRTWGNNPSLEYWADTADGQRLYGDGITCSGCGYDKESTVVAEVFNKLCLGMAIRKWKRNKKKQIPYGLRLGDYPYFEGGVGIERYKSIAEYLGGKMEHLSCGKTWDEYLFTFKTK